MTTPLYYTLLFGHLIGLVIGFGSVIVIDSFGLLWVLKMWGMDLSLVRRVATITQRLIWVGFVLLLATGIPMLVIKGSVSDLTKLKLFLVLMLGLNGVFLHFIKKSLDALGENITDVPARIHFRISLASTISQLGWWGAALLGFLNRQVRYQAGWTHNYPYIIGAILLFLALFAAIGSYLTRGNKLNGKPQSHAEPGPNTGSVFERTARR